MEILEALQSFITTYKVPFNIALIILLSIVLRWLLQHTLRRVVSRVVKGVKRSQATDLTEELSLAPKLSARAVQRTRTLGAVGKHIITWTIGVISIILILGQLGVDLAALLTSAGIVAAALAFGAQNLIKDLLNGIFMVSEDQLGVGDWITIGEISGTVEDVGIRVTQVRAVDGTLWFIRNGEVLTLGNSSQGWGRAIINITVDAHNDLDLVENVALEAAREVMKMPEHARKIIGEPEVWGVESMFGDRATLRLAMRTRPEAQWAVQRALRLELVRLFDKHGITLASELPTFPGATP
ncbi:mechanosensitive ion channel family protein [Leucobacter sp. UCMA 4100]|uniref:mechanosensitive ion channel family protein n=1 Tax=Leucobacter sp. UCMA 4100 TaxID=2810534 RepID=UPI0022EAEE0B|nr:mechanosensitive ion channel family protein [Leucobacter sp. UCMA 4100]MDA3145946.1 mechanosensitive ion channel family protein [Leucobacter sp. UCMA 4100]